MRIDYSRRIFGFDLLRGGATVTVVAGHSVHILPDTTNTLAAGINFLGILGVEMFFVLSGFLIGRILYNLLTRNEIIRGEFRYFLARRWFRTLPNYYLLLLVNIVLLFLLGREMPEQLWSYFIFLQNFSSGMGGFYGESWSLTVEEFVYLLGPILLFLGALSFPKKNRKKLFLYIILTIIASAMAIKLCYYFNLSDLSGARWNDTLRTVVIYRYDSIFYGMVASYIALRYPQFWKREAIKAAILGLVIAVGIVMMLIIFKWTPETAPFFWNVIALPLISIAFALIMPLCSEMKTAPAYIRRPITYISIRSYTMYLLHFGIILKTMLYLYPTEGMSREALMVYAIIYMGIVFGLTHLWYRYVEKPATDLRDKPSVKKWFLS
ncbi:acyltransferase [Dokdonia sinensis]|uniref:Acyltransferase n=1 Tax=Dokdonia sinensis TaxID=2479847 RepID=A0A3M0GP03_9FLAO|nr:acyltransferase [Dokdonia sinensis]RMB62949.1 acyltransferase [Dokdonia sinensis]